jgi:hypothetical protein
VEPDAEERRLVARYRGADAARSMADLLLARGVPSDVLLVGSLQDLAAVGWGDQRREARHASVGIPLATGLAGEQMLSGWFWSAIGFLAGFAPFFVLGLFVDVGSLPTFSAAALVGVCGGLGGAAVGVVYGLARGPELDGATRASTPSSVLSVPADAMGSEAELVAVLGSGPVASVWLVAGERRVPEERLAPSGRDHPSVVPSRPHRRRAPGV